MSEQDQVPIRFYRVSGNDIRVIIGEELSLRGGSLVTAFLLDEGDVYLGLLNSVASLFGSEERPIQNAQYLYSELLGWLRGTGSPLYSPR